MTTDRIRRLRIRLALWMLGGDALSVWSALWLIRDRARNAITPDGRVILSECKPLAEVLYAQVPGTWTFTISGPSLPSSEPAE